MKRNIVVSLLLVLLMLLAVSCEDPEHVHTLEKVEAVAATCSTEGVSGIYQCSVCKLIFADQDGKTLVTDLSTLKTDKDPANHSEVKNVAAVESTCTEHGTIEHWHCEGCGKNYSDEACEKELESLEAPLKAHETKKVDAVAATCTEHGTVEHWHCEDCGKNFSDEECVNELESVVAPRHGEGDVVATEETFTVGGVEYPIYKCNHDNYYLDEDCTERLYKDYLDVAGLVVTEKDGVLDAYFSDCEVFMSTETTSSYGFNKAVAYFTNKNFARLGYNDEHVGGLDATENKALTLTAVRDEEGNIQITGESQRDKKPLTGITSITLNEEKTALVMVANGGETWNLIPYNNPLRGTYTDAADNTLTFGRYVMKYTLSGEEAFYVADIDETHVKILSNETNSGDHGNTTFGFRQYVFLANGNLYVKWDVDLPGVSKWSGTAYYEYVPCVE